MWDAHGTALFITATEKPKMKLLLICTFHPLNCSVCCVYMSFRGSTIPRVSSVYPTSRWDVSPWHEGENHLMFLVIDDLVVLGGESALMRLDHRANTEIHLDFHLSVLLHNLNRKEVFRSSPKYAVLGIGCQSSKLYSDVKWTYNSSLVSSGVLAPSVRSSSISSSVQSVCSIFHEYGESLQRLWS